MQYLKEVLLLRKEDHLSKYIPLYIFIQNFVCFRIALKRCVRRAFTVKILS